MIDSRCEEFADFVRARGAALQRTAFLLTGDWAAAEDLLQTVLARSYVAWSRIRHEDPEGYIRAVLVNTYASWWRRRWRGELPTGTVPDRPAPDEYTAVDDRAALAAALGRLPRRQRITIVLRFHEDMTEAAVAATMHCSIGTVKSQTAKALARLRTDPALSGLTVAQV
jgi:RNA polymerase sigma-70 factor (sigma-E family)